MAECGLVPLIISGVDVSVHSVGVSLYIQFQNSCYVTASISFGREVLEHNGFYISPYRLLH